MKRILTILSVVWASGAFAYNAGETFTVPSGATVTVTDADIADFNALASVTFADAAGVLVFNTATPPTVPISGNGTIRKTSSDEWSLKTAQNGFAGTWDFTAGETTLGVRYAVGNEGSKSNVYVRAGATLTVTNDVLKFGDRPLHLAGSGASGRGAFRITAGSALPVLKSTVLDDDADIVFVGSGYIFHNAASADATALDLNAHTLTLRAANYANYLYMMNGRIVGPGRIVSTNTTASGTAFAGGLSLRGSKVLDPSVEVVMHNRTSLAIYNHSPTNYFAKLTVEGERCRMYHSHQAQTTAGLCMTNFTHDFWVGPVHLKNPTSKLELGCAERADDPIKIPYKIGLLGPVSGPGSLSFGTLSDYPTGVCSLACPTNTYTGATVLNGDSGATFYLPYSNSVPVYSGVTFTKPLTLKPNGEEHGWGAASIARFAERATFTGTYPNVAVYVDASALPESTLTFDGAAVANALSGDWIHGISGVEGTTLVFASPLGRPVNPQAASNSVTKLAGTETLYVTNPVPKKYTPLLNGEIVFDGAKDIRFQPTRLFAMSAAHGAKRYVFKNCAMTYPLNTEETTANNLTVNSFTLGHHDGSYSAIGDMVIGEGAVITGKMLLGASAYTHDRILQTGGTFATFSGFGDNIYHSAMGRDAGTHSYYELAGGSFTCIGAMHFPLYGSAVFRQTGGTLAIVKHPNSPSADATEAWLNMSYGGNTRCHFIAEGGTANLSGVILAGRSAGFHAVFTVAGDANVVSGGNFAYGYADGLVCVNLNGGRYSVRNFNSRFKVNEYTKKGFYPEVYLNANGGTLAASVNTTTLLGPPAVTGPDSTDTYPLSRIALYGKGLIIDVGTRACSACGALTPATGKGVASVPLEAPIKGLTASAFVKIAGDGHGATAVMDIDRETGDATGIRVTSAGFDYTWAKATFMCGTSGTTNKFMTVDCTLADNGPDGGLTVEGSTGTLTLMATNTYHGATTLAGGTLTMGCDWAIPADSTIVLGGGKLLMNGKTLADGSTMPKNWAVDMDRVREAGTVTNKWNLAFPAGATFTVLNADELTEADQALTTLLYVDGTVTGAPEIQGVTDPRWKVAWNGKRVTLRYIRGTTVTIR